MLPFEKGETKCPLPSLLLPAMNFRNPGGCKQTDIEPNASAAREAEIHSCRNGPNSETGCSTLRGSNAAVRPSRSKAKEVNNGGRKGKVDWNGAERGTKGREELFPPPISIQVD